jgi:hypothetical protein
VCHSAALTVFVHVFVHVCVYRSAAMALCLCVCGVQMDFDLFVEDPDPVRPVGYNLRLLAAVCHHGGRSVQSGHYTAYVLDDDGALLRFDDLAAGGARVGRAGSVEDVTSILHTQVAHEAYLLLYELVRAHDHVHTHLPACMARGAWVCAILRVYLCVRWWLCHCVRV